MITFAQAIQEIGEWSFANFGNQKGAEFLAPLAGIIEEIGEQQTAFDPDEIVDGYCDQLVYLADVAYRADIRIDPEWNDELSMALAPDIHIGLGTLSHALLKRHQGIRGFDDDAKFVPVAEEAIANVFHAINRRYNEDDDCKDRCLGEDFTRTWQAVSRRNWKADPRKGTAQN